MRRLAIVGGGIVGATIAYELSALDEWEIVWCDRATPASGATRSALGVLMGAISRKTKGRAWQLRSASIQRYETLIPELERLTGLTIPFNRQGILLLRFAGDDLESWQKLQEKRLAEGWPLEIWDRDRLQARCPQVQCNRAIGAIYSPRDRQVDPTALTLALAAAAQLRGVRCSFGCEIQKIESTALNDAPERRCIALQVGDTPLEIDRLIVAAGLGSTPLTAAIGPSLSSSYDLRPVLGQALHLKLPQPLGDSHFQPVITGDDVHIVPLGEGEYWVGATVEFPDSEGNVTAEASLLEEVRQSAIAFCPELEEAQILSSWSGLRPRPEGRPAPIIERLPGYSNVIVATGHYRNGVLLAPGTAIRVRELLEE
ncbi:FAD-dependent oxidoreductase [Oscillatoria sp. FACHB-1406]|uniref:NAD(P)/FAD-dependent oxidoreductase n=1 Tax=Oscillatoria sp. FACHB-1406 TaxID=2692846 RepID=UPI001685C86E|nr:FAD-dependent oxidoreductase [Oscillatoria sp. FACHB-1406]MBD2580002.1 FAD-binding oxidoreductase [Oscillatoria sp. FACHB-1406]